MKSKLLKFTLVIVVAIVAVINFFNTQKPVQLSDVAMANVEALAQSETSDEFTKKTCCKAVTVKEKCDGCDGNLHSYAVRVI